MNSSTNPSTTKKGPGRTHLQGHKRAKPDRPKGAPFGFVQHVNPNKPMSRRDKHRAEVAAAKRTQK